MESNGFSELARLGDLSMYTCQQLMDAPPLMHKLIEEYPDFQRLSLENDQVLVSILYSLEGTFLSIEREVWKNHGMDLNHLAED